MAIQYLALATLIVLYSLMFIGGYISAAGLGLTCPEWPECPNGFMPSASEAISIADLIFYIKNSEELKIILNNFVNENKSKYLIKKPTDFLEIGMDLAKSKKVECLIEEKILNKYFQSSIVIKALAKRDILKNMDYINLINSSKILEEIIK